MFETARMFASMTCGCGRPEEALEWIRDALRVIKARTDSKWSERANRAVEDFFDDGKPTYWVLWYFLDSTGLIEHGGTVVSSWLTDDGNLFLSALERFDIEEIADYEPWERGYEESRQLESIVWGESWMPSHEKP